MSTNNKLCITTATLEELLYMNNLKIPVYQRPYAWKKEQVVPLLRDISNRKDGSLIIMGGIILHKEDTGQETKYNIVDGQQRLITFSLIKYLTKKGTNEENKKELSLFNKNNAERYTNGVTKDNIRHNSNYIKQYINSAPDINLDNIHFIVVTTNDLNQAFSFFDSQNTRGKQLEDHEILKANHLRYIKEDSLAQECAKGWEDIEKKEETTHIGLNLLLNTYLGRGRKWENKFFWPLDLQSEFKSQRKTAKSTLGYSINKYQQPYLFKSWRYDPVEKKAGFIFKDVDAVSKEGAIEVSGDIYEHLPFQIGQTIEGGELFFWYTQKYYELTKAIFSEDNKNTSPFFKQLCTYIDFFDYNSGCTYIKQILKASILFYIDKFGYDNLDEISSKLFLGIYWLRFKSKGLSQIMINAFIRDHFNPFSTIKKASIPEYIIDKADEFITLNFMDFEKDKGVRSYMLYVLKTKQFELLMNDPMIKKYING